MVTDQNIKIWIEEGLQGSTATIKGDDGHHFEGTVIYTGFAGKSMLEQHRMVYATLGEKMGGEIHALSLKTMTEKAT